MPPASITTLPTEILIELYKSLNNMKDVTALNRVLPRFHDVWCKNTVTISDAVFPRTIKGYDEACELVKIQQKFCGRDHGDDNGYHGPYGKGLERHKLIIMNARRFEEFYEWRIKPHTPEAENDETETAWSRIYYSICTLILTEKDTFAQSSYLASCNPEIIVAIRNLADEDLFGPTRRSERRLFEVADKLKFGSAKFGEYDADDALRNAEATLEKHVLAFQRVQ